MHDDATEAQDIAAEVLNLITRRLTEGASQPVICLGLAEGIALTAKAPGGCAIGETVRLLLNHFAAEATGDSDA